jgi:hypothetical protein
MVEHPTNARHPAYRQSVPPGRDTVPQRSYGDRFGGNFGGKVRGGSGPRILALRERTIDTAGRRS